MSIKAGKKTIYDNDFKESIARAGQPDWLKEIRREAFARFTESGFPTVRDEEWKYTNTKDIASASWPVLSPEIETLAVATDILEEIEGSNKIVFVDGVFRSDLSATAKNVYAKPFAESYEDPEFKERLAKIVAPDLNGFTELSTAFAAEGVFIRVSKNEKLDQPLNVVFIGNSRTSNFPRVLYIGETSSEAELVERYVRTGEAEYFSNVVVEISLADEARLVHTRVQRESHSAFHVVSSQAELGRGSSYDNTNINLGAKLSRHDIGLGFNDKGAEAWVDGLYLVDDDQHTDTHSRIDHRVPNCVSHQSYKGILDGRSRAVFNGKVFVRENASGTDAFQSNKNLLLSDDARVDTKPQLEIFNDDVKCAHGATVGQLEEEELFYLLSRGLNEDLARNLLTYGFAEEVIEKIKIPSIKKALDEAVLNRLHARLDAE